MNPTDKQYKETALRIIAEKGAPIQHEGRPEVQRCQSGAFVQCWVWVRADECSDSQADGVSE